MLKNVLLNLSYLLTFTKKYKDTIITLFRLGLIFEIKSVLSSLQRRRMYFPAPIVVYHNFFRIPFGFRYLSVVIGRMYEAKIDILFFTIFLFF